MDATLIAALAGLVTGVFGVIISGLTARSSASRQEVDSLRNTIRTLTEENERLRNRVRELELDEERRKALTDKFECEIAELQIEIRRLKAENLDLRSRKPFTDLGDG